MRFLRAQAAVSLLLSLAAAAASEPRIDLDYFSFFFFEGANEGEVLPSSIEIPLALVQRSSDQWETVIAASDLVLPPIPYPSGLRVTWKLDAKATGALARRGGEWTWTLEAPLEAYVESSTEGIPFLLRFTTESASLSANGETASRQGVRLSAASGYFQLVAVGVNPEGAATAPGKPFYAVLSGHLLDLPDGFFLAP